ncbi:MAG: calcium-binding protein, partial [Actinomycetota bacterium]
MKKRIALAAAIALAISVGGMFPASAAKLGAPVIAASSCARAGGTLEVKQSDGNLYVSVTGTQLVVDTAEANSDAANCSGVSFALSGLTSVILKADGATAGPEDEGTIWFDLEGATAGTVASWGSLAFTVQAGAGLWFDGSGLDETTLRPFNGTITEETFTVGTLTGAYYAGVMAFLGGSGNDVFDASAVSTTPLIAVGNIGADTIKGGAEDDDLTGSAGNDVLYGNAGDDLLHVADGGTCVYTQPGAAPSRKCRSVTASGQDEAWGGLGDDGITSDGGDTVAPGDGIDEVTGNAFSLNYSDSGAAVSANLTTAAGLVTSTAGNDYYSGTVAEFVGSAFDDKFVGSSGANVFYGGVGADTLVGLGGADFLSGGGGADAIKGTAGADEIYGDTGADLIIGGADNDIVYAGGGDDVMYGRNGDDVLRGEKGSDQAWGGKGTFDVCAAEVTDS